jgi:hypothetical protein
MVNVVGDWNGWNKHQDALAPRGSSGIWEGFVKGIGKGTKYKFHIEGQGGYRVDKADPLAFHAETPPKTASVVWDLDYTWGDAKWMEGRSAQRAGRSDLHLRATPRFLAGEDDCGRKSEEWHGEINRRGQPGGRIRKGRGERVGRRHGLPGQRDRVAARVGGGGFPPWRTSFSAKRPSRP